jgi:hypothetical protein
MKIRMEVPQKTKNRPTLWTHYTTLGYISKKYKLIYKRDTHISMFIAALFTIAKLWNWPRLPKTDKWRRKYDKIWYMVYIYIYTIYLPYMYAIYSMYIFHIYIFHIYMPYMILYIYIYIYIYIKWNIYIYIIYIMEYH